MPNTDTVITPEALLEHWQGHRRITRRVIEAFPEKELFEYSIGGMRPFAVLATEMLKMAVPIARGVGTSRRLSSIGWGRPFRRIDFRKSTPHSARGPARGSG